MSQSQQSRFEDGLSHASSTSKSASGSSSSSSSSRRPGSLIRKNQDADSDEGMSLGDVKH